MKYKVHLFPVKDGDFLYDLEQFLNSLAGEVISVVPKIKKLSLPQIYGVTEKVDYLLIVEKTAN